MSTTTTVLVNVVLGLALVTALLVLLGYPGIHRDRHHRARLRRWHGNRAPGSRPPRHVAD